MRIGIASEHGGLALLHHFSGQDRRIVMEAVAKSKALKPPLLPLPSPQLKSWKTTRNGAGGEDRAARGVNRWQRGEENQRTNERTSPLKITAGRFLWPLRRRRRMRRSKAANDGRGRGRGSLPSLRRGVACLASHRSQDEEGTSKDDGFACHKLMHGGGRGKEEFSYL